MRTVLASLSFVLLVTACGSSSERASAPHRLTRGELASYLRAVNAEQRQYERERQKVIGALLAVNPRAQDSSWTAAAKELRFARNLYEGLAERMGAISPPRPLRLQHSGLARSLLLYSEIEDAQGRALARRDLPLFMRTVNGTQRLADTAHDLRTSWRVAARKAARQLGVDFPPRLAHVGTIMQVGK